MMVEDESVPERTIEDRLREEYFSLLPGLGKLAEELEAEVRFHLVPISRKLDKYEQIIFKSRIKACESAVDSLRRRQEGGTFDREKADEYSLLRLHDLVGMRVLAFPRSRLAEINTVLRERFRLWTADHVRDETNSLLAYKYYGHLQADDKILCEYQIVSVLAGLFWEVEHAAIYKPAPELKLIADSLEMKEQTEGVYTALRAFEAEFERLLGNPGSTAD